MWSAEKKNGYADVSMKMVIRTTSTANAAGLEAVEGAAETAWNGSFLEVQPGAVLSPDSAYKLNFDEHAGVSFFKVQVSPETNIAIFAEHSPTEFENRFHYFITEDNEDLEPAYEVNAFNSCESPTKTGNRDRAGEVILSGILVMLPTLLGILFIVLTCPGAVEKMQAFMPFMNAAASGVLVAVAVFLILPEAHHLLASTGEAASAAIWGASIICGWLLGVVSVMMSVMVRRPCSKGTDTYSQGTQPSTQADRYIATKWFIALPVELGDFFHNFADGLVIGIAFLYCDISFAWKIVGISVAHELPQEPADVHVLVNKAGLHWSTVTIFNVFSGSGVIMGACLPYLMDIGSELQGVLLALGP